MDKVEEMDKVGGGGARRAYLHGFIFLSVVGLWQYKAIELKARGLCMRRTAGQSILDHDVAGRAEKNM